jgi:hypothetical protein
VEKKTRKRREPSYLKIRQRRRDMPTNNSIQAGSSGVFEVLPLPVGTAFAQGDLPSWTADDTSLTLTPSADGTQVTVAVPATDTNTSFNLTASYTRKVDGTTITDSIAVAIIPVTTPEPTSLSIQQLS